jgi:glucose/arabinose dehydrogenase/PKD repeat protein
MSALLQKLPRLVVALVVGLMAFLPAPQPAQGQSYLLPRGFVRETVSANFTLPTGFAFAPDGRIFITEKSGKVWVVQNGQRLDTPFVDISDRVNTVADRGLLHVAVHPRFPTVPYVYLAYVYEPPEAAGFTDSGARVSRVSRFEASRSNSNVAVPGSEVVILGAGGTWDTIGNKEKTDAPPYSCVDGAGTPIQDCVPNEGPVHSIGSLAFGPDGALYVASGDGVNYGWASLRAQNLDVLVGKILRINPTNGQGYANNPFYDGNPNSNRSKVYALGMKNPWRLAFHPVTGELYATDVGQAKWEEINRTPPGANLGWPCWEGPLQNAFDPECEPVLSGEWPHTQAWHFYPHLNGRGAALGGDFLRGTNFPAAYRGNYFFSEFNVATIERIFINADGAIVGETFGSGFTGGIQVSSGPGGALYFLSITEGALFRVVYKGESNVAPTAAANASPSSGQPPLRVNFSSSGTFDPDGDQVTFRWEFGDGSTATDANPTYTYERAGQYTARLTVTDPVGASSTDTVQVSVGSDAPTVEILSPQPDQRFRIGETISLSGRANDAEDGTLSGNSLRWVGILHHNEHVHYDAYTGSGTDGRFVFEDHGDNTYLELCLTATDSSGLQGESCVDVRPQEVVYTIDSVPSGISLAYGGSPYTTPFKVRTYVGAKRTLSAPSTVAGGLRFESWSDGGNATHEITIGNSDRTLTVRYANTAGEVVEESSNAAAAEIVNEASSSPIPPPPARTEAASSAPAGSGTGEILREYWEGVSGKSIEDLMDSPNYPDSPTGSEMLPVFETARVLEPDYGSRIRGYVHPPVSGDYRFFVASDDASGLWLSTDENPANAIFIAGVSKWTGMQDWTRYPEQASGFIKLEAGKKYYIEVVHKQGDGKDNLAVGWQIPGRDISVIDGAYLSPWRD